MPGASDPAGPQVRLVMHRCVEPQEESSWQAATQVWLLQISPAGQSALALQVAAVQDPPEQTDPFPCCAAHH